MNTLPRHMPPLGSGHSPSAIASSSSLHPHKRNPFAKPKPRPKLYHESEGKEEGAANIGGTNAGEFENGSFSRATLLPSILSNQSPIRPVSQVQAVHTPDERCSKARVGAVGSTGKPRSAWRLLWRGGLEIGKEGFRLDGITFFAQLSFPSPTPSAPSLSKEINPFDVPIQPVPQNTLSSFSFPAAAGPGTPGSPFPLTNGDTDLCLSLESMRGRKYLQVRGLVELPAEEVLEGEGDATSDTSGTGGGGVQMSISPQAPLLAAYFTGILCRNEKLSSGGRTLSAIMIGLGDEGVDSMNNSSILVYGQRQSSTSFGEGGDQGVLKLCVGKRRPPPAPLSAKKVRPGEPLPRAPLFFPAKAPKKPPSLFPSRSLSRTSSLSWSIYHPPPLPTASTSSSFSASLGAGDSGQTAEKRGRIDSTADEEGRKRKAGRTLLNLDKARAVERRSVKMERNSSGTPTLPVDEDDIFSKRGGSGAPLLLTEARSSENLGDDYEGEDVSMGEARTHSESVDVSLHSGLPGSSRTKKRVPQRVLDNKATIRKQTLVMLESRGISRTHEVFKDVFGMTTKGTCFALRDRLESSLLSKLEIQRIVAVHLDMYLPSSASTEASADKQFETEDTLSPPDEEKEGGRAGRQRDQVEEYSEVNLEGTVFHSTTTTTVVEVLDGRIKLESVEEEEEDED